MPGAPLSLPERDEIHTALTLNPEVSWAHIARRIGRHPSTVAREVDRHGGRTAYRPATADRAATAARKRPRPARLAQPGPLRDRVRAALSEGQSPYAIAADLYAEGGERVCVETIYQSVYNGTLDVAATDCLRRRRPRRRHRQTRHPNARPALPNISERPAEVDDRSEAGHWEADLIIGARNRSALLWLTERQCRYSIGVTMPDGYNADATLAGLVEGLEQIPAHLLKSITFDQGSEWAEWPTLELTYGIDCWFCDPHSPWQRGQVENLNRQWRWWFPRGTRLDLVEPAEVDRVAAIINGQRRRSLDDQSPANLYHALTAH
jgi:IS30 family transposase